MGATLDSGSAGSGGLFGKVPADAPRRPRSEIPADLTCTLCDPPRRLSAVMGFQGHMRASHGILYEAAADAERPLPWRATQDTYVPVEPQDLPGWCKLALVRHELLGEPYSEIATDMGKAPATLQKLAATKAGIAAVAAIREHTTITNLVQALLKDAQLSMYVDWCAAFEWAKAARDYKMVHQMVKDVGLQPALAATAGEAAPPTLVINLAVGDLQPLQYATSGKVIDAVVDDDDDG